MANDEDAERAALMAAKTVNRQRENQHVGLIGPLVMALLVVVSVALVYMTDDHPAAPSTSTPAPAVVQPTQPVTPSN